MPGTNASWYWRHLCRVKNLCRTGYNQDKWIFKDKGYSAASGYDWLRKDQPDVQWANWVWNRLNVPKYSFICWLVMWKRLQTKDRLQKYGIMVQTDCLLCDHPQESVEHLFFQYKYSRLCYSRMDNLLQVTNRPTNL